MNEVMPMRDAIAKFVKSGDPVFLSGAQHGSPTAAIAEKMRQRIDHLLVVAVFSGGINLIGGGLVDKLITGYSPSNSLARSTLCASARQGTLT